MESLFSSTLKGKRNLTSTTSSNNKQPDIKVKKIKFSFKNKQELTSDSSSNASKSHNNTSKGKIKTKDFCQVESTRFFCKFESCSRSTNLKPNLLKHILAIHFNIPYSLSKFATLEVKDRAEQFIGDRNYDGVQELPADLFTNATKKKTKPKENPVVCDICDKIFCNKFAYIQHRRIHTKTNPYSCKWNDCKYSSTYKRNVLNHISVVHQLYPWAYLSKMTFDEKQKVKKYLFVDKKLLDEEKQKFSTKKLSSQIRHDNQELHDVNPDKPFLCQFEGCFKSFKEKCFLQAHYRHHANIRPFYCKFKSCSQTAFHSKTGVRRHIYSNHFAFKETQQKESNFKEIKPNIEHFFGINKEALEKEKLLLPKIHQKIKKTIRGRRLRRIYRKRKPRPKTKKAPKRTRAQIHQTYRDKLRLARKKLMAKAANGNND